MKICGITRLQDAEAAVGLGANALGFVFWPKSARYIDPLRAKPIIAALPPFVSAVGVFVNQSPDEVNDAARLACLAVVQLHGDETPQQAALIDRPIVKALTLDSAGQELETWPANVTVLLDAHDPDRRGGTGRTIDWGAVEPIARRRRLLLAGGLNPDNISEAVGRVRPFGVDISSGVETAPGIKDPLRLRALFENLNGINSAPRS